MTTTAALLGISAGTVGAHLHRALAALRTQIPSSSSGGVAPRQVAPPASPPLRRGSGYGRGLIARGTALTCSDSARFGSAK
jgi:hypothetical protein